MSHWLMKSEPDVYGIDHLRAEPRKTDHWDGIRNFQARNFMRSMRKGELAFFYHSNCDEPGIVGVMQIVREAYTDHTQFEAGSKYFDPKSKPEDPRWVMVDVRHKRKFRRTITLRAMKEDPALEGMRILQRGNRLSITPVNDAHWNHILTLAG